MRRSLRRQGNLLNGKPNTVAADPRSEALRALTRFVVSEASLSDTLTRIATITTEALPHAAFAGMTLLDGHGTPTTAIFTSPASPEIDAAQYETGEGPCLDAWRKQRAVLIDDTEDETAPYRAFRAAARERGVRSTLSLPLLAPEGSLGALNLYAEVPHGFSEHDQAVGTELNDVVGHPHPELRVLLGSVRAHPAARRRPVLPGHHRAGQGRPDGDHARARPRGRLRPAAPRVAAREHQAAA